MELSATQYARAFGQFESADDAEIGMYKLGLKLRGYTSVSDAELDVMVRAITTELQLQKVRS